MCKNVHGVDFWYNNLLYLLWGSKPTLYLLCRWILLKNIMIEEKYLGNNSCCVHKVSVVKVVVVVHALKKADKEYKHKIII